MGWIAMIRQVVARGGKVLVTSTSGSARPEAVVYAYLRAEGATGEGAWRIIHALYPAATQEFFTGADAALPTIPPGAMAVHPTGTTASTNVWWILGTGAVLWWLFTRKTEK